MARLFVCSVLAAAALGGAAVAQDVSVTSLAAPDLFSAGAGDTGLGPDLWRGASAETAQAVLPILVAKPLTSAGRGLARRVLATGANGPEGAGNDADLAGARIEALIAQGGVTDANAILARSSGLDRSPQLARAAAEAALLADQPDRACAVSDGLTTGREDIYWLRLRAYCQLRSGQAGAAHLTFDLAQSQARDVTYGRLMGAKLAGGGDPGAASLRNGLDYALSKDLGLDLSAAKPSPAVAAVIAPEAAAVPPAVSDPDLADAINAATAGAPDAALLGRLTARAAAADAKGRAKAQNAALIFAALGGPITPEDRGRIAKFTGADAKAAPSKAFALDLAADQKLVGETALLALSISADAGAAGPLVGDRVRIIRALRAVGLDADGRAYAVEGLAAQK